MASETDLRRASDDFLARLDELDALERVKREEEPGSERFVGLAERIVTLATELLEAGRIQASLGERASEQREAHDPDRPVRPIAQIEPRDPTTILAEWRDHERRLAGGDPGLDEEAARRRSEELRDEYRAAFERRTGGSPG